MKPVKVTRTDLLEKVQANRSAHRSEFIKAQEGYRKIVIEELDKALRDARENRGIRTVIALQPPQDHTEDYDKVIAMLQMSVDEIIEIEEDDFNCYVMDNWQWSAHAKFLNSTYAAGARP